MATLTAKTRNAIPGKSFAGPDRSYPIEDKAHARDALSRSSGKPVHAKVAAAVHRKYPDMRISGVESAMHKHADIIHPVKRK